jgi:uncharacterized membrane protein YeaQ/YmgE (transglycosylase-associated protein family)
MSEIEISNSAYAQYAIINQSFEALDRKMKVANRIIGFCTIAGIASAESMHHQTVLGVFSNLILGTVCGYLVGTTASFQFLSNSGGQIYEAQQNIEKGIKNLNVGVIDSTTKVIEGAPMGLIEGLKPAPWHAQTFGRFNNRGIRSNYQEVKPTPLLSRHTLREWATLYHKLNLQTQPQAASCFAVAVIPK